MTQENTSLFGLSFYAAPFHALQAELRQVLQQKTQEKIQLIFTPNPEQIVQSKGNPAFFKALKKADYRIPDGVGIIRASQILHVFSREKTALSERITGVDLVDFLLREAKKEKKAVLIAGGEDYQEFFPQAKEVLEIKEIREIKEWQLFELEPGIFWIKNYRVRSLVEESTELLKILKLLQIKIIFVALGAPKQEYWLLERKDLFSQAGLQLGVVAGGTFDFLFGKIPRASKIWRKLGLEWFYRLKQEPWRWRRQLRLPQFILLLLKEIIFPKKAS